MFSAVKRFVGSIKGTIWLIALLGVVFLLGLWIPQKGMLEYQQYQKWKAAHPVLVSFVDALQLNDIYTAPFVFLLWALFFINLSMVTWRRIPAIRRQMAVPDPPDSGPDRVSGFPVDRSITIETSSPADVLGALQAFGYRISGTPERFRGIKYRLSAGSSILFHLSFFLILLGGMISTISRFQGVVDLATGETFDGDLGRYSGPPKLPKVGKVPDDVFTITAVEPKVIDFTPTGLQVCVTDRIGNRHYANINSPFVSGHTYYVVKDLGVAPLLVLRDLAGKEVEGAFFKLNVLRGKEDGFRLGGQTFHARFFPDFTEKDGVPATRSEAFKNPVFSIAMEQPGGKSLDFTLRPGSATTLPQGTIAMPEMRYWVRFVVIRERGLSVVYAGFLLAVLALSARLVLYRRELIGSIRSEEGRCVLHIAGRSDFYRALAEEEFDRLLAKVKHRVSLKSD